MAKGTNSTHDLLTKRVREKRTPKKRSKARKGKKR